jgi:hypothetical protein
VDLVRFELTTSSMPWKRAPNCATGPKYHDAEDEWPSASHRETNITRIRDGKN